VVILKKIAASLVTIALASFFAFFAMRVLPGDPARLIVGRFATPEQLENMRQELGLDEPLWVQYYHYMSDFFGGDWGFSYTSGTAVTVLFSDRLPATLELGLAAAVIAFFFAVLLALLAAYWPASAVDKGVRGLSSIGLGTPPFWLGLILLIVFFERLRWLPGPEGRLSPDTVPPPDVTGLYTVDALLAGQMATFRDALAHLVLPALTLAFASFAFLVRILRSNLLDVRREPFMVVVRSKGFSRWHANRRHALPNASLPTLTAAGMVLATFLTGSVLAETVFSWPGVGALVVESISRQDYAVVEAFILVSAFLYVVINLIVDLLYGVIDPRVRNPSAVNL
jgi:peptide/nickel transport system permease protein